MESPSEAEREVVQAEQSEAYAVVYLKINYTTRGMGSVDGACSTKGIGRDI